MTTPFGQKTLADFGFGPLMVALPVTCLDVGARGGFTRDLLPLAPAVRAIGFEPDTEECARLNESSGESGPWRELRFIPVALGKATEVRQLNIYRKRGCSSLLDADSALAGRFGREDYYILDGSLEVPTTTADQAAAEYDFADAAFFKLDVQGAELEILQGSRRLLEDSLVALRVEVSFIPIYKDQPLFADIDQVLRSYGFSPMRFLELHPWRRASKAKLPRLDDGPYPYSEGQLVHGDVLYFREPESLPDSSDGEVERLLRAALLALTYGLVDHALAIFRRPTVRARLGSLGGLDVDRAAATLSQHLARSVATPLGQGLRRQVRSLLGHR